MTVAPAISSKTIRAELKDCGDLCKPGCFEISEVDEESQTFVVKMRSRIDQEEYVLKIKFDNYNEWPPILEFIDPSTGQEGTKHAYPKCTDSFFHDSPCVCNPCSRKSYGEHPGVHRDWNYVGWKQNPKVGSLTNLRAILGAVYSRINSKELYVGRMA